jgi:hypothetical protein
VAQQQATADRIVAINQAFVDGVRCQRSRHQHCRGGPTLLGGVHWSIMIVQAKRYVEMYAR